MSVDSDSPLKALSGPVQPPAGLKEQVTRDLRQRGLLAREPRVRSGRVAAYVLAAAAVLVLGFVLGKSRSGEPPDTSPRFALLLYEDAGFQRAANEQDLVTEYAAWARGLRSQGKLVLGEALRSDSSSILSTRDGAAVAARAGDAQSDLGSMSGFFIIRAPDAAAALAVARECPHLKHGGRVIVRPIIPT